MFDNFEVVSRIGGAVEMVRSQLANKSTEAILKQSAKDIKLKVDALPESKQIIS
jgi:hypothetical protein